MLIADSAPEERFKGSAPPEVPSAVPAKVLSHPVNGGAPSVSASPKKNENGGSGTLIGAGLLCSQLV